MLIEFTIKNIGPIGDEITLSFEPGGTDIHNREYLINTSIPDYQLLKIGIIYGPNASGKSTLLMALSIMRILVLEPLDVKTKKIGPYQPNKSSNKLLSSATEFTVKFIQRSNIYTYHIEYNDHCIQKEWLRKGMDEDELIFLRDTDQESQVAKIIYGNDFKARNGKILDSLDNATLWNNTVTGASLKINSKIEELNDVCDWFRTYVYSIITPETDLFGYVSSLIKEGIIKSDNILKILRRADLGIKGINIKEVNFDELPEREQLDIIRQHPDKKLDEIKKVVQLRHVEIIHESHNSVYSLDYGEESMGTQRFYQLCGVLDILLRKPCLFTIDEIENSIHPDLLEYFIYVFLCNSTNSQLIFTTHYRELLLNKEIVRPDTIWFTTKEETGMTALYSMDDFDKGIFKGVENPYYNLYKNGRFGAKPILGDFYINLEDDDKKS